MEAYNILERIVIEKLHDGSHSKVAPRILVHRRSVLPGSFSQWFNGVADRPGYPLSKLIAAEGQADWASCFKLDPLANQVERDVIELDFSHYSRLEKDSHAMIKFGFTVPIEAGDGANLLYGVADRGFLWAHGFLCRFEGSFDVPEKLEFLNVWRS